MCVKSISTAAVPDSKRKAKYQPNSDRASYSSILKKDRATTAISARWNPVELSEQAPTITGSRIMNMTELSKSIEHITSHSAKCGGNCMLEGETHVGLATVISARCTNCHYEFKINSSTYTTTSTGAKKWHINIAAVVGQMSMHRRWECSSRKGAHNNGRSWNAKTAVPKHRAVSRREHERTVGSINGSSWSEGERTSNFQQQLPPGCAICQCGC